MVNIISNFFYSSHYVGTLGVERYAGSQIKKTSRRSVIISSLYKKTNACPKCLGVARGDWCRTAVCPWQLGGPIRRPRRSDQIQPSDANLVGASRHQPDHPPPPSSGPVGGHKRRGRRRLPSCKSESTQIHSDLERNLERESERERARGERDGRGLVRHARPGSQGAG